MHGTQPDQAHDLDITIPIGEIQLSGSLIMPSGGHGVVLFAHGSGSSRHSPRNQLVAERLRQSGLGTLLIDLLTEEEEQAERVTRHLRFDIDMLAERLVAAIEWLLACPETLSHRIGVFGASTGGGAALAAAARKAAVAAVVSRGGRPDLAGSAPVHVRCPTLFIVGGMDDVVVELNMEAFEKLAANPKEMVIVPGASHLFEEPGKLQEVARLAAEWFARHLS